MMNLQELNNICASRNYPQPEYTSEGYRVSARRIHKALKISLPFAVWFAKARYEIEFEKGEDYRPIRHVVDGRMVKDYNVTLTIAKDMGTMCCNDLGNEFADFYGDYRTAVRSERLDRIEKRIEEMEKKLGIFPETK